MKVKINGFDTVAPKKTRTMTPKAKAQLKRATAAAARKKRQAKYCKRGHRFNKENTKWIIRKDGSKRRLCRTCKRDYDWYRRRGIERPD